MISKHRFLAALLSFVLVGITGTLSAQDEQAPPEGSGASNLWNELVTKSPWVFLGDSNTYSGGYVAFVEAWMRESGIPENKMPRIINLGMSSETAAGTSEVDHPFKRPCVHERIDKLLTMTRPGVVFICYGMNDGIYGPLNDENLAEYHRGMFTLAQKIGRSGAKLICLTPPPFEIEPVKKRGKVGPTKEGRFAYFAPTEDYDQVIQAQAAWCKSNPMDADLVIDIYSKLKAERSLRQADDPDFCFSRDGVHFGTEAHAIVAEQILVALGAPSKVLSAFPPDARIKNMQEKMTLLRNAYLTATGKNRPGLPAGLPVWYAEMMSSQLK